MHRNKPFIENVPYLWKYGLHLSGSFVYRERSPPLWIGSSQLGGNLLTGCPDESPGGSYNEQGPQPL